MNRLDVGLVATIRAYVTVNARYLMGLGGFILIFGLYNEASVTNVDTEVAQWSWPSVNQSKQSDVRYAIRSNVPFVSSD